MDWSQLGIRLQFSDIPRLGEILGTVAPKDIQDKRKSLEEEWTRFVWVSPSRNPLQGVGVDQRDKWASQLTQKDVFSTVMEILAMRVKNRTANGTEMYRSAPPPLPPLVASQHERSEENKGKETSEKLPGSKCDPRCFENGSCNEELGRCDCLPNYSGPHCTEWAMPACHLSLSDPTYSAPCHLPSTCSCTAQCAGYKLGSTPSYTPVYDPLCLDDKKDDGTLERDPAKLSTVPHARVHLNASWHETSRTRLTERVDFLAQWANPEECPALCTGQGGCEKVGSEFKCK